jgi:competence ComEA-like helix-hairpin-helix protein
VRNTGNVYTPLGGRITIAQRGKPVTTVDLDHRNILPGVHLDVPGAIKTQLPAGDYELTGTLRSRDKRFPINGRIRLFGPNQIATPDAKIVKFENPTAYRGEPVAIHAVFKNTGNIKFSPSAQINVGVLGADPKAKPLSTTKLSVESVAPGATGDVSGSVRLPDHGQQFQLTLILSDHGKVLDTASLGVGVRPKPTSSFPWWIVVVVIALLLAAGGVAWRRRRNDRADLRVPAPAGPAASNTAPVERQADGPAAGLNLNVATAEQLTTVPGIGPKAAQRIVEHRDEFGAFASVDALAEVEGFGEKRVEAVFPYLEV